MSLKSRYILSFHAKNETKIYLNSVSSPLFIALLNVSNKTVGPHSSNSKVNWPGKVIYELNVDLFVAFGYPS